MKICHNQWLAVWYIMDGDKTIASCHNEVEARMRYRELKLHNMLANKAAAAEEHFKKKPGKHERFGTSQGNVET